MLARSAPPPSSASTPIRWTSRWTSAAACPRSPPSACPTARSGRAGSASVPPWPTRVTPFRSAASPSTWPRRTSRRPAPASTCPSRSASWWPAASCPIRPSTGHGRRRGRPGGRPPPGSRRASDGAGRAGAGCRGLLLPPDNVPEAAVVAGPRGPRRPHPGRSLRLSRRRRRSLPAATVDLAGSHGGAPAGRVRLRRRPEPGRRQAGARGGGGRRPQPAAHRPARCRQDHARPPASHHPAVHDPRRGARNHQDPQRGRGARSGAGPSAPCGPSGRLTTPSATRGSSAAGRSRGRGRSVWPTAGCCSSTSCPNSAAMCSRCCASPWRTASSR